MTTISNLFDVAYGNKLDMNKMKPSDVAHGVAFVGRIGGLNGRSGVSGFVAPLPNVDPYPAGLLTVALGGSRLLSTYVQQVPFYTAQNVAVLTPRDEGMPLLDRLYYATCIRANAFRYSAFGREANRTLSSIELPDDVPGWVAAMSLPELALVDGENLGVVTGAYSYSSRDCVPLGEHFNIEYGHGLTLSRMVQVEAPEGVNFVSRKTKDNGISGRVLVPEGVTVAPAGTLSVALSATPLATFYQSEPYVTGYHVAVLRPKTGMSVGELLWWKIAIEANKYRYSYGRQANRTLASILVPGAPPEFVVSELERRAVPGENAAA